MSEREIALLGDPVLRKRAEEVEGFDEDLRALVRDMFATMVAA
jgi:peptide deformylase